MIQQDHLQVYDLTLTTRSPLFVGSGTTYIRKEYTYNPLTRQLSFFNNDLLFQLIIEKGMVDKYERFMLGKNNNLFSFLRNDCHITDTELKRVTRCTVSTNNSLDTEFKLQDIQKFMRNANGRAYVPGSSVKGAIRTAILLNLVLKDNKKRSYLGKDFPEKDYLNTLPLKKSKNRNGDYLPDTQNAVNSILRGIQISDSLPVSDDCMILAEKLDVSTDGRYRSINVYRESIRPGTTLQFKLTLDQSILKNKITADSLMDNIQAFDTYYYDTYLTHFELPLYAVDETFDFYDNSLILGGGAGFFSKTLVYPYLGEEKGLETTIRNLDKNFKKHRHKSDRRLGISPRKLKYTRYEEELYPFGVCGVSLK